MSTIDVLEVIAVGAITVPLVLAFMLLCYGAKAGRHHWKIKRAGIRYVGSERMYVPLGERMVSGFAANARAESLLRRLYDVPSSALKYGGEGFKVTGGATGHTYQIMPRAMFPIADITSRTLLCGKPFNAWILPIADTMLAQALYLQSPETERAFVAICNKTAVPSSTLIDLGILP